MKLESIALHHGYESEKTTKAATTPIYQTTSFTFDDTKHGKHKLITKLGLLMNKDDLLMKKCMGIPLNKNNT